MIEETAEVIGIGQIIWGGCRESVPTLEKFDFVFTNPHFNIGYPYTGYTDKREDYESFTGEWVETCWNACRGGLSLHGPDCLAEAYLIHARRLKPINLKAEFGAKWQIGLDEAARRRWADPWNDVVRCKYGHLYPVNGDQLGAATDRPGVIVRKLRAIDGVDIFQDAEDGANAVFHFAKLRFIARVMKPKSIRKLSSAQRFALAQGRLRNKPLD